jgi:hypothetical protein
MRRNIKIFFFFCKGLFYICDVDGGNGGGGQFLDLEVYIQRGQLLHNVQMFEVLCGVIGEKRFQNWN